MTRSPEPLSLAARRAAWDRLWQILLAPGPELGPGSHGTTSVARDAGRE